MAIAKICCVCTNRPDGQVNDKNSGIYGQNPESPFTLTRTKMFTNVSSALRNSPDADLEFCVRNALATGELSPATHAYIQQVSSTAHLTRRDRTLLAILKDAIRDGCVQQAELNT
jgi:hypothetical protein